MKRTSSKPLRESRRVINYALLNDGLDPERSPSPKRKRHQKIRLNATGPSVMCTTAHAHSMNKKQRTISPFTPAAADKDGELADLENIMDSFDMDDRVIGTIVKLDESSQQFISDSPPRITLNNEIVTPTNMDYHDYSPPVTEGNTQYTSTNTVKLTGVTPNTSISKDDINKPALNPTVDNVSPENAELDGVTSNNIAGLNTNLVTPVNAALKGVTPNPPSTQTIITIVSASITNNGDAFTSGDVVTPANEKHKDNETLLPDLVTDHNNSTTAAVIPTAILAHKSTVTPANSGEFDFPALSSEEDNGYFTPVTSSICNVVCFWPSAMKKSQMQYFNIKIVYSFGIYSRIGN